MEASFAVHPVERVGMGFARLVGAIEDWVGTFFATTITLVGLVVLIAKASSWQHHDAGRPWLGTFLALWWLALDGRYAGRLILIALRGRRPFALTAASEKRMWPVVLRPIIVAWWLIHFLFGVVTATSIHFTPHGNGRSNHQVLDLLIAVGFGFAANGFLMLSVCAATRSARFRMTVWRCRGLIDIGLGVLGVLLSSVVRSHVS